MRLIVGLGNPGKSYARHRHNIGFMAVDAIADKHAGSPWKSKFNGELCELQLGPGKVWLLKPATYMNESGQSVSACARFFQIEPSEILIIHDELDLGPGKLRMKQSGGHGGHNGLRSISAHIGDDYRRMRLGIGHPDEKSKVSGYVLHDFSSADQDWLMPLLEAIGNNATFLTEDDAALFANRIHLDLGPKQHSQKTQPEKPANSPARANNQSDKPAISPATKLGPLAEGLFKLIRQKR